MKKAIIILITVFVINVNQTIAQDARNNSFGISINPFVVVPEKKIEHLNETTVELNVALGFVYFKDISPKIRLVSGLNYSQISFSQKDYSPLWPSDHNGRGGALLEKSWKQDNYKSHYLGLPINLNYSFLKQKNSLYVSLGFEYMLDIKNELNTVNFICGQERTDISTSPGYDNNNLSKLIFGIGYEISNSNHFKLLIEPEFEYYLNSLYKDLPLYSNSIITYGVNFKVMLE